MSGSTLSATTHSAAVRDFRRDLLAGLRSQPKRLPSKYFYDQRGSQLFDRICELEEYYPTRTEIEIMRAHAAAMADQIGPATMLIELGSGSSLKTGWLLEHLARPAVYVPVDISREHLHESAARIGDDFPDLEVCPLHADFSQPIEPPASETDVEQRVVYFPGSTIGNFPPQSAVLLLQRIARLVGEGGGLLIGFDLVKDPAVLEAAYNDSQGVTAAFNKNMLQRANKELDANFNLHEFKHLAFFNDEHHRIEMHLVSQSAQRVAIGNEEIKLAKNESIRTELSHKYSRDSFAALAAEAGFSETRLWTDSRDYFAVAYFTAGPQLCVS